MSEWKARLGAGLMAFIVFAGVCLAVLPGCLPRGGGMAESPAAMAGATVIDEKALAGAELAYKAMRTAGVIAVDAGALKGDDAARIADLDNRAYAALIAARTAYQAGNARDYASAIGDALRLIGDAQAILAPG